MISSVVSSAASSVAASVVSSAASSVVSSTAVSVGSSVVSSAASSVVSSAASSVVSSTAASVVSSAASSVVSSTASSAVSVVSSTCVSATTCVPAAFSSAALTPVTEKEAKVRDNANNIANLRFIPYSSLWISYNHYKTITNITLIILQFIYYTIGPKKSTQCFIKQVFNYRLIFPKNLIFAQ